ncbi:MAG: hypothetical protein R3E97_13205 [Candidatus Eisenbacteria bacterium]
MSSLCPTVEELVRMAAFPGGDSRRRHLDACPKCRSTLASYRSFESPRQGLDDLGLDEAELAGANRELSAFLASSLGSPPLPSRPRDAAASPSEPSFVGRVLAALRLHPIRFLVPATAALAAVVLVFELGGPDADMRLRNGEPPAGIEATLTPTGADTFDLVWTETEPGLVYSLVLYGADLEEKVRFPLGTKEKRTLHWSDLFEGAEPDAALWQLVATRQGEEVLSSAVSPIPDRK